ncbi:hypothetical protein TRVA0_002S04852 [Trichomonascus vanleenenianus]|uniref:uncharacterized protein n=1 Tax=Trichomonascus vanleenenianus TaxID=2268995 RepID=UPI003ECAF8E9
MSQAVNRVHANLTNGAKGASSPVRLPPMLSPTLPAWVDEMVPEGEVPNIPQRMLSPTLPPMFDSLGSDLEIESLITKRKDAPKKANGAASLPPKPIKRKPSVMVVLLIPKRIKSRVRELMSGEERGRTGPVGLGITNGSDRRDSGRSAKREESKKRSINWSYSSSSEDEGDSRRKKSSRPMEGKKAPPSSMPNTPTTLSGEKKRAEKKPENDKRVGLKKPPSDSAKRPDDKRAADDKRSTNKRTGDESKRPINHSSSESKIPSGDKRRSGMEKSGSDSSIKRSSKNDSSPVKRSEKPASSSGSTPQTPTLDSDQREKYYKLLRSKMHGWVVVAQDKKHEADKATMSSQHNLSAAVLMDSTVAFLIGFDYEDKADMMIRGHLQPKSWSTLLPYLGRLAKMFEKQNCRHMVGLTFQLRAIVHLKIASIHQTKLRRLMSQNEHNHNHHHHHHHQQDEKSDEDIPKLTSLYMAMHDGALQDFKRGATELPLEAIEKEYPKTWAHRSRTIQPAPKHEGGLRPNEDPYCLPVHTYTSIREAAAFGYTMMKEWAEKNNIKCEWSLNKLSQ